MVMRGKQTFDSYDVLCIELTNLCNFNCIHCGNFNCNGKHLDFKDIKRAMDDFEEHGGKKLIFSGGEPLLHPRIKDILDIASEHSYNVKISTNGFVLAKKDFDFVFEYDIGFRISLDGPERIHNKIRNNKLAYSNALASMKKISDNKKQLVVRSVVMRDNKDFLFDMIRELDGLCNSGDLRIYSLNLWPIRKVGGASEEQILSPQE